MYKATQLVPYHWKPGQSGNPGGRPKQTEEEKLIKKLTREQFQEVVTILLNETPQELQRRISAGEFSVLQCMVASVAGKIIDKGDVAALDQFLDRMFPKPPEEPSGNGSSSANVPVAQVILTMPDNGRSVREDPDENAINPHDN
jgi:hypothetical protein